MGNTPSELRQRMEGGEWVVDVRNRTAFAAGHTRSSLNFGLDGSFATYLGWLITWGTPVTLLGATPDDIAEAQGELVRIGIDRPATQATGSPERWTAGELVSFPTASFADLEHVRRHREVVVLGVRRTDEHGAAAISGAVNIPLHELWHRLGDVPAGEVWVHCAGGYRASVAASMLDATGRRLESMTLDRQPSDDICRGENHVQSRRVQDLRQDHLGRMRPAHRTREGRCSPRPVVLGPPQA